MNRLLAIVVLLIALVAVAAPSAVVASRGFVSDPAPVLQLEPDGTYVKAPCLLTGGKRPPLGRPDIGVIPALVAAPMPRLVSEAPVLVESMPAIPSREPSLPPPRYG